MKTGAFLISCGLLGSLLLVSSGRAQAIATFDENSNLIHVLANNESGAVSVLPESLLFDVIPLPGSELIGVTVAPLPMPIDFAPNEYRWLMRLRILEGNDISYVIGNLTDFDVGTGAELWEYRFDISSLTPADGWVKLRQDFSSPTLTFGNGDGILNPGLEAIAFGVVDQLKTRLHVELDYLQIVPVPEPGGMALVLLGMWAGAARVRARRSV